jgi:hypothetical protein
MATREVKRWKGRAIIELVDGMVTQCERCAEQHDPSPPDLPGDPPTLER